MVEEEREGEQQRRGRKRRKDRYSGKINKAKFVRNLSK